MSNTEPEDIVAHNDVQENTVGEGAFYSEVDSAMYEELCKPFSETHTRRQGGTSFTYITGEQATTRANLILGPFGWSFRVVEHGINTNADEVWVLGEMQVIRFGEAVIRQQFGSQKINRRKSDQDILDIGFDMKGAATDAFKKCAASFGIGLYLSKRDGVPTALPDDEPIDRSAQQQQRKPANSGQQQQPTGGAAKSQTGNQSSVRLDEHGNPVVETILDLTIDYWKFEREARDRKAPNDLNMIQCAERARSAEATHEKLDALKKEVLGYLKEGKLSAEHANYISWLAVNRRKFLPKPDHA